MRGTSNHIPARLLDRDGFIIREIWTAIAREGGSVATCVFCGADMAPLRPHENRRGFLDYEAECGGCHRSILFPNGRARGVRKTPRISAKGLPDMGQFLKDGE